MYSDIDIAVLRIRPGYFSGNRIARGGFRFSSLTGLLEIAKKRAVDLRIIFSSRIVSRATTYSWRPEVGEPDWPTYLQGFPMQSYGQLGP